MPGSMRDGARAIGRNTINDAASVLSAIIADHVFRKRARWLIFGGRQIRYLDVRKAALKCNLAQMLKNCVLNASPQNRQLNNKISIAKESLRTRLRNDYADNSVVPKRSRTFTRNTIEPLSCSARISGSWRAVPS